MVVQTHAGHFGRGPMKARTVLSGDVVLCLLEDILTTAGQTLIDDGKEDKVLDIRATFQETMRHPLIEGVQELTGCRVLAFISGSHVRPDISSELFVLDQPLEGPTADGDGPRHAA
jgi:uncharacterized protein YbcI